MKYDTNFMALIIALIIGALSMSAQVKEYKTFVYTSSDLSHEIQMTNEELDPQSRGFGANLWDATLGAVSGIGTGYVTSLLDVGINALGNLLTRSSRLQKEWEQAVNEENRWSTKISSIQELKDFYGDVSTAGALDPLNMIFDGIGCMRMEGNDTVFFISCHIDRSKLDRIIRHSKFELVLDTLIISPAHSNLPNTNLPLQFSFDERKDFNLSVDITLSSSWFTDAIELHRDVTLGEFNLNLAVTREDVDSTGYLRYIRPKDQMSKYPVTGECFIVPRSYMGYRDENNRFRNIWGTGQYKLDVMLGESCGITPEYRASWKADRKKRNKMKPKENYFTTLWETVSSQKWDEITRSWVITTLSAPAGVITSEMKSKLGGGTQNPSAGAAQSGGAMPGKTGKQPVK